MYTAPNLDETRTEEQGKRPLPTANIQERKLFITIKRNLTMNNQMEVGKENGT